MFVFFGSNQPQKELSKEEIDKGNFFWWNQPQKVLNQSFLATEEGGVRADGDYKELAGS